VRRGPPGQDAVSADKEIAREFNIKVNTIKSTIRNAYRTLRLTSRSQAVSWCLQHGFLPTTELSEVHEDAD
jgi:Bacterial regulatory proteins, luxR family